MEYAQWGDIVFEVLSYREHKEETSYIYARHETIYPPSSLQWMGKELRKLSMGIRWHAQWCDPADRYRALQDKASEGVAQKLIVANKIIGDFVVEKINSTVQQLDAWGKPVMIDAELEFTEYVKKELEKKRIETKKKAPAKTKNPQKAQKRIITRTDSDGKTQRVIE